MALIYQAVTSTVNTIPSVHTAQQTQQPQSYKNSRHRTAHRKTYWITQRLCGNRGPRMLSRVSRLPSHGLIWSSSGRSLSGLAGAVATQDGTHPILWGLLDRSPQLLPAPASSTASKASQFLGMGSHRRPSKLCHCIPRSLSRCSQWYLLLCLDIYDTCFTSSQL